MTAKSLVFVFALLAWFFLRIASANAQTHPSQSFSEKDCPGQGWITPAVRPRAVLLAIHGLGLNSRSYELFGRTMASRGVPTYAIDVRGFGKWQTDGTHTPLDLPSAVGDVNKTLNKLRNHFPHLPLFLLGESMGGALAIKAAAKYDGRLSGLIASVPSNQRFSGAKTAAKVGINLVLNKSKKIDVSNYVVEQATSNDELRLLWLDDPGNRLKLSASELLGFQKFMNDALQEAASVKTIPVLVIQGAQDRLVKPEGTINLFRKLGTADKDLLLVGKAEHLIFEKGQFSSAVIEIVDAWLKSCARR